MEFMMKKKKKILFAYFPTLLFLDEVWYHLD